MSNSFEYMKHQAEQLERMRSAETAHQAHIIEFKALCAKMIEEAIPEIKRQVKEDLMREWKQQDKTEPQKTVEVKPVFSAEQVKTSLFDALKRAFRR